MPLIIRIVAAADSSVTASGPAGGRGSTRVQGQPAAVYERAIVRVICAMWETVVDDPGGEQCRIARVPNSGARPSVHILFFQVPAAERRRSRLGAGRILQQSLERSTDFSLRSGRTGRNGG